MRYIVKSFIMRLKFLIMGLALLCASTAAVTGQWEADILDGYERTVIAMPDDYSGKVVATVVKKADMPAGADVALLYVHGYNDYFFPLVSAKTYQSIKTMPATPANRRCECSF